ncbi:RICIN domain-containing protein [Kitasatospora sp. GP82]|uniref:RICIN domain-containing protein n=1 Tax=Kitasatospora sp. GP82 TaxID=3035089 RepID=UPI0024735712|nr:RICIN domain-containing protein [Kitasatospora sp. GP82]MDH6127491.1 DNA-directed RNA polymerase specialized sigma24 family protein [Kitasatospora sp. GP82]
MSDTVATALADAELARRIRDGHKRDRAAVEEITGRHRAVVLAYARQCCTEHRAAEKLTDEAFERTLAAVRTGAGPTEGWRPYLLAATRRAAAGWAGTERGSTLSAGFTAWLTTLPHPNPADPSAQAAAESDSLMVRAFQSLPQSQQADLWHYVEEVAESPDSLQSHPTATPLAGIEPRPETAARRRLHDAYLQTYIARARNRSCRHLAVRMADGVQRSPQSEAKDVDRHLSRCASCARARMELTAIHTWQRPVLLRALLLWSGEPSSAPPATACPPPQATAAPSAPRPRARRPRAPRPHAGEARVGGRRALAYSVAAGIGATAAFVVAAVVLATVEAAGAHSPPTETALVPFTASSASTASHASTPATSASATLPAAAPVPPPSATVPAPAVTAAPSPSGPVGLQLINLSSGLCVGIADPTTSALQLQPCTVSGSQGWERLPAGRDTYQLRNTGTGNCLDGTTGGGNVVTVVLQSCRSDSDRAEQLWRFAPGPGPGTFRLWLLPPVPSSDYPAHLLGPQNWPDNDPPHVGSVLVQLPNYYNSNSFLFTMG